MFSSIHIKSVQFLLLLIASPLLTQAYTVARTNGATSVASQNLSIYAATTTAPPREKTKTRRKTGFGTDRPTRRPERPVNKGGPLEYLVDDMALARKDEDPFHILLLGSTFGKPRITTNYVSSSLVYVLDMPETEASDHAEFAKEQGVSCLGMWTREECLVLGQQLQNRDLVCRVVPFCEGGSRPWQAKRADMNSGSENFSDGGFL